MIMACRRHLYGETTQESRSVTFFFFWDVNGMFFNQNRNVRKLSCCGAKPCRFAGVPRELRHFYHLVKALTKVEIVVDGSIGSLGNLELTIE